MDVVMKLNFDDIDDVHNNNVSNSIQESTMYNVLQQQCDVFNMSGVMYQDVDTYTDVVNVHTPKVCNSPKKMQFSISSSRSPQKTSPKSICSLRLFNSPTTPNTLLEKCAADSTSVIRNRKYIKCQRKSPYESAKKRKPSQTSNVNPFTPTSIYLTKKRSKTSRELENNFNTSETPFLAESVNSCAALEDSPVLVDAFYEEDELRQIKKLSLRDANVTRYRQEFLEFSLVGKGQFGAVYKCKHRLDGCIYAIKKSLKPIAGSVNERTALNEVYAHAVLGKHPHVVRYYSAWAEQSHMLIQNEYCNGGSLSSAIRQNIHNKTSFCESELKQILLHIAKGLKYVHSQQLVHMDIKPDNIFIVKEPNVNQHSDESADDGIEEDLEYMPIDEEITYKIGDLGHVTSVLNPQVEEGDCRYLPREILEEDFSHLQKCDIFSLGLTIYEAASKKPLPLNGQEWQSLRDGNIEELSNIGSNFQILLKMMMHPDPLERPSAAQIIQQLSTTSSVSKSHDLLRRELVAEKMKNEILSKQLNEATKCLKIIKETPTLSLNAAIASGVLAGVSSSPARSHNSRPRNTRSVCRKYNTKY